MDSQDKDKQQRSASSGQNTGGDDIQRALVLQGGGALGAYEVGAIKSLYMVLSEEDKGNRKEGSPLFDIIAGTSIGAINAAILVSNVVVRKNSWVDSIKVLENFWTDIKDGVAANPDDAVKQLPWYTPWQKQSEREGKITDHKEITGWHDKIPFAASEEAARRHFCVKFLSLIGMERKVFSAPTIVPDYKFFDPDEKRYLFTNNGLRETIEKHADFPIPSEDTISNKEDEHEIPPRLLVTSVDIAEGIAVIFDSYKKPDGSRKSEYGKEEGRSGYKHIIKYQGITLEHIMASATLPQIYLPEIIDGYKFWDGGLLSNTPFRELLESYQEYWLDRIAKKEKDRIPKLEVYIVNVHPSKGDINPIIYDEIKNRENNIVYGDRSSEYDQKVAMAMTDYVDIINEIKDLALKHLKEDEKMAFTNEYENSLLTKEARRSTAITGKKKSYGDLILSGFELTKVIRIERKDDLDSVSNKITDFTLKTIQALIKQGETDAMLALGVTSNEYKNC